MKYRQRRFAPEGYVPRILGYCRVSHKTQHERGNSVKDQEDRIRRYIELRQLDEEDPLSKAKMHKIYIEPRAQSAYRREFSTRPAGKRVWNDIQPGDHLVVDKLDRMFRSIVDFCTCAQHFGEMGVRVHFINFLGLSMDTGSKGGMMFLQIFALMGEWESDRIGERVQLARAALRGQGKHQGARIPFFCRLIGSKKRSGAGGKLIFKDWAMPAMEAIAKAKDGGVGFEVIGKSGMYDFLRKAGERVADTRPERIRKIRQLYWFYKAWVAAGKPDVNTINTGDLTRTYYQKHKLDGKNPAPNPASHDNPLRGGVLAQPTPPYGPITGIGE